MTDDSVESPLDREEIARIEVGQTEVSPRVARLLVAWFIVTLALLPIVERFGPAVPSQTRPDGATGGGAWSQLADLPAAVAEARVNASAAPESSPWTRLVAANRAVLSGLSRFESGLEDASAVAGLLRPPAQALLSGWLGAGNERAYIGRDGWLFFRSDVDYVTGRGFLESRQIARRIAGASEYDSPPQPDPRPAIRRFARDLSARGITLILMPTPVKPSVHPDRLSSRTLEGNAPAQNASYGGFVDEIRRDGILVFDPAPALMSARDASGAAQYLLTDTHWRPDAMQRVAGALAAFITAEVPLPPVAAAGYRVEPREAQQQGDIAAMLDLPASQTRYRPERVRLDFVLGPDGEPWRPSRSADVLLLGDSFTNIYSLATMGWGEAAGLAEHLSLALQRPVDRIVQNDEGAVATRRLLARDVTGSNDRLTGKRVVVWQFAVRELSSGDWAVVELAGAAAR
ncbi:MAG: alginate O-acetyltransferase AlgX-related protein [Acidobacteriota bacterium]